MKSVRAVNKTALVPEQKRSRSNRSPISSTLNYNTGEGDPPKNQEENYKTMRTLRVVDEATSFSERAETRSERSHISITSIDNCIKMDDPPAPTHSLLPDQLNKSRDSLSKEYRLDQEDRKHDWSSETHVPPIISVYKCDPSKLQTSSSDILEDSSDDEESPVMRRDDSSLCIRTFDGMKTVLYMYSSETTFPDETWNKPKNTVEDRSETSINEHGERYPYAAQDKSAIPEKSDDADSRSSSFSTIAGIIGRGTRKIDQELRVVKSEEKHQKIKLKRRRKAFLAELMRRTRRGPRTTTRQAFKRLTEKLSKRHLERKPGHLESLSENSSLSSLYGEQTPSPTSSGKTSMRDEPVKSISSEEAPLARTISEELARRAVLLHGDLPTPEPSSDHLSISSEEEGAVCQQDIEEKPIEEVPKPWNLKRDELKLRTRRGFRCDINLDRKRRGFIRTITAKKRIVSHFLTAYAVANKESSKLRGHKITEDQVILLEHLCVNIRPALRNHANLLSKCIGQGLLKTRTQLEAAMLFVMRQEDEEIDMEEMEYFCGVNNRKIKSKK